VNNSFFNQPVPLEKTPLLATSYTMINQGKALKDKYPIQPEKAAAGLWTNASDLVKMIIQIQKSFRGDKNSFFSKKTASLMLTPYNDETASIGFFIENHNGHKYFNHAAGNPGMSGKFIGSIEGGKGVVILANSDAAAPIFDEIIQTIANLYSWEGFEEKVSPIFKNKIVLNQDLLKKYTGVYQLGNNVLTIEQKGNELWLKTNENDWQMHFTNATHFVNVESKSEKFFEWDAERKSYSLNIKKDEKRLKAKKVFEIEIEKKNIMKYLGDFKEEGDEIAKIELKNDKLWLISENAIAPMQLHFLNQNDFYLIENGGIFSFEFDKNCKQQGIKSKANNRTILRKI
jgi:hypothetical protein